MLRKEYIIRDMMREEMKLTEVESVKTFDAIQEVFREAKKLISIKANKELKKRLNEEKQC